MSRAQRAVLVWCGLGWSAALLLPFTVFGVTLSPVAIAGVGTMALPFAVLTAAAWRWGADAGVWAWLANLVGLVGLMWMLSAFIMAWMKPGSRGAVFFGAVMTTVVVLGVLLARAQAACRMRRAARATIER